MALQTVAVICLTLMTGNEICVAAFVNPVLRKLPEAEQIPFLNKAASQLGKAMPFWYILSFAMTAASAFAAHRAGEKWPIGPVISLALQLLAIVMTIAFMVPINNQLGRLRPGDAGWNAKAVRWDHLHQLRVILLLAAVVTLAYA